MGTNSPYKFLDFYNITDQDIFFGREREINILEADVLVNRLVVLFARTGTGKTSLINAGVRPRLESRGFRTFYVRVEHDPTEAALDLLRREDLLNEDEGEDSLSAQLCAVVKSLNQPIVLFFDQFEEFFIQISDRETRRQFIKDIAEVYRIADSGVHLVFSMREEYFHEMDEFRSEIPSIFHKNSNLRLLPLDHDQARAAITGPAEVRELKVEPALTEALIRDLSQEGGISPTGLQIVCDTLWRDEERKAGWITLNDYQRLEGWRNILDQRLEQDIEVALTDSGHLSLMQRLIPELRTERNTKYPRLFSDLVKTLDTQPEALQDLAARLKGVHILREITISGASAIEWASDYLAERTDSLQRHVKTIELKRLLQSAIRKRDLEGNILEAQPTVETLGGYPAREAVSDTFYLTNENFEEFSQHSEYLTKLTRPEVEFLFDNALYYQRHMKLWFDQISRGNENALDLLGKKVLDKTVDFNLRVGATRLLGELTLGQALPLLEQLLDDPDLALEAIDILVKVHGEQATQLLAGTLARDDLWDTAVLTLTRAGTGRAVKLLEPLLQQENKIFPVLNALERLARTSRQVGDMAENSLEVAIPVLDRFIKEGKNFFQAVNALERLTKFNDPLGARSEEILEAAIPFLEEALEHEPTVESAGAALQRLSKFPEPLGGLAKNALRQSKPELTEKQEGAGKKLIERFQYRFANKGNEAVYAKFLGKPSAGFEALQDLVRVIDKGRLIPVIGNAFRIEHLFREENEYPETTQKDDELSVNEQLTMLWADYIGYPLANRHNLPQIAQYYQIEQKDPWMTRKKYIDFLKDILLDVSEQDERYRELAIQLRERSNAADMLFSEVVQWLDYPKFPEGVADPLQLLARLPLPVYLTTSYFNFMERALEMEGKQPRSEVCFWRGTLPKIKPEHYPDPDYEPTPAHPVVYHLFGLEDYPETLVLTEDDYLGFLVKVAEDTDYRNPLIPIWLRARLSEANLLLLGYQFQTWDSRTLFTFLSRLRTLRRAPRSLMVQAQPKLSDGSEIYLSYQQMYLEGMHFDLETEGAERFLDRLWDEWAQYGQARI